MLRHIIRNRSRSDCYFGCLNNLILYPKIYQTAFYTSAVRTELIGNWLVRVVYSNPENGNESYLCNIPCHYANPIAENEYSSDGWTGIGLTLFFFVIHDNCTTEWKMDGLCNRSRINVTASSNFLIFLRRYMKWLVNRFLAIYMDVFVNLVCSKSVLTSVFREPNTSNMIGIPLTCLDCL